MSEISQADEQVYVYIYIHVDPYIAVYICANTNKVILRSTYYIDL